ncbi:uncharacterized protein SCHCODRAFT_0242149 [Schizophyllum commune H4-8]|uniref:uncharacterized protein n=1 Tax=Schizophyllum commune (strain H4-8 / FGSC 9210) TaxID=578458 RepID=UPI00215FF2D2|nr:uncharacterized protein SCHCODRAFT_0242149 [Schizophyllum commune H4-8]KAI5900750.1 hypothetical protein SCHCODRAFT_0242149 [Schizophyllum commune H4-8]
MLAMQPGPSDDVSVLSEPGYRTVLVLLAKKENVRDALQAAYRPPVEPRRSPNGFMVFRSWYNSIMGPSCTLQQRISMAATDVWRRMTSAERALFMEESERRKTLLFAEHPDFEWNAKAKGKKVTKKQRASKGAARARRAAVVRPQDRSPSTPAPAPGPLSGAEEGLYRGSVTPSCCTPALSPSGSSVYEYTPRRDNHALPSARWTRTPAPVMPAAMMPQVLTMQEKPFGYDDFAQMVAIGEELGPLAYRPHVEYGPSVNMLGLNGVQDFPTATIGFDTQLDYTPSPSPLPLGDVVSWTPQQAAIGLSFFPEADIVAGPSTPIVPTASQDFPTAPASFDTQHQLTPCPSPLPLDEDVHWTPEQVAIGLSFFPDADTVAGPSAQTAHTAPHPAPEPQAERSGPIGPPFAPTPSLLLDQPVFPTSEIGWNLEGFSPQPASLPAQEASEAVQPGLEENWLNLERCSDEPVAVVAGPSNRDEEWQPYLSLAQRAIEGQERTRRAYHPYRYPYHQQLWWHRGYY